MTNPRFWTGAGESPGKAACLAHWAQHFGQDAGVAIRFLRAEGKHAGLYPHPRGGPPLNIVPGGCKGFQAVSSDEWDDETDADYVSPIDLTFEEAQAHTFDLALLGDELCACCGLRPEWASEGGCLYRMGRCDKGDVYAFLGLSDDAPKLLRRISDRNDQVGCVMMSYEMTEIRRWLETAGVACVTLCECFTVERAKIGGKCGERCKALERGRPLSQAHFDARMDTLGQEYGATKIENMRLNVELAQNILKVVEKADPEFVRHVLCVLAAGSVNKAAKELGLPNSTFSGKLKERADENTAHRAMYRMIKTRQSKCGMKSIERFNETWAEHQGEQGADSVGALLKAVVEGLERMRPDTFGLIRDELMKECAGFL